MFASTLTTAASFQVVLFSKNDVSFFRVVEVAFLSGYISVAGHIAKMDDSGLNNK